MTPQHFIDKTATLSKLEISIEKNHLLDFLNVTESAAIACKYWIGKGDKEKADQAACEAMRNKLNEINMQGTIVIGEGERDEAPMLYIGERLGKGEGEKISIAVDPLEGTNLCANGKPNSIAVLAATLQSNGFLMNAPDCYMEKLVVGEQCVGTIDIDLPPQINAQRIAKALNKPIQQLVVGILDRPRHQDIILELRKIGACIHLVSDGDLSLAISALDPQGEIDVLMGTGGAPEGVISAAATLCYKGEMQAKLVFTNEEQRSRAKHMISGDINRKLTTQDLAHGNVTFFATGITSGPLLKGIISHHNGFQTESIVMSARDHTIRRIHTTHQNEMFSL